MLSESDASLIAGDPLIPGLKLLLDDEALLAAVAKSVPRRELVGVHTEYLRYKPGVSCLARIHIQSRRDQSYAYAVAYGGLTRQKMLKAGTPGGPAETTAILLRDHAVVVYPFPLDRRLPSLRHLANTSSLRELLRRVAPQLADQADIQLTTLRYKPERRYVAQLAAAGRPIAALKIYSATAYRQARRAAKTIGGMATGSHAQCIGHSSHYAILLFDWIDGLPLSAIAADPAAAADEFCLAARALHCLHEHRTTKLPTESPHTILRRLRSDSAVLTRIAGELTDQVRSTCSSIADRLQSATAPRSVPIHGDLHLDQFVVGRGGPLLLDFDRARLADPAEDLGSLYADMLRQATSASGMEAVNRLFFRFLSEYAAAGGQVDQARVHLYAAFRLIQLAVEPFRNRHPDWVLETRRLVETAQQLLATCPSGRSAASNGFAKRHPSPPARVEDPFDVASDFRLAGACQAIDPRIASQRLGELACADNTHAGIELDGIRVLRHKSGRRCLVEYAGRSRTTGQTISLLGKIHARERHDLHFRRQQLLWNAGFQADSPDGVSVARPWGVVPEWGMWFQEKVTGQIAWQMLHETGAAAAVKRIAYALAKLHDARVPAERFHTMDDEIAILRDRLSLAAQQLPDQARRILHLLAACERIAAEHVPGDSCPVHRDFYPDQVLVNGNRIILVDFDLCCHGEAAVDIGNFRGHLIEHSLRCQGHVNTYTATDAELVAEYARLRPGISIASIEAYTALSLARHVFLCALLPGRQHNVLRVLEACERLANAFGINKSPL
jgi:aminoglycoside phosphotransferase (APT) family kinase protein